MIVITFQNGAYVFVIRVSAKALLISHNVGLLLHNFQNESVVALFVVLILDAICPEAKPRCVIGDDLQAILGRGRGKVDGEITIDGFITEQETHERNPRATPTDEQTDEQHEERAD